MVEGTRIRDEREEDREAVARIIRAAFGRREEADLLIALRGLPGSLSLVAEREGRVVAHAFFSPVRVEEGPSLPLAALGPIAVDPPEQRRGLGGALIREGLARCREAGVVAVFVLGDPAYYGRHGFELAAPHGLHYQSEAFDPAFQVQELRAGGLEGCRGLVAYPDAFRGL